MTFPPSSGIQTKHFWPADAHNPATGHSWLVAPPFAVIDLTVKQQPHREGASYFPDHVITEATERVTGSVDDVVSPELKAQAARMGIRGEAVLSRLYPYIGPFWGVFPPQVVRVGDLTLKYVATGVAAPETPHDVAGAWECNGRPAGRMYLEVVLPHLREFRAASVPHPLLVTAAARHHPACWGAAPLAASRL